MSVFIRADAFKGKQEGGLQHVVGVHEKTEGVVLGIQPVGGLGLLVGGFN